MKMRKTIYPLALIISIPLVLLVFYILNQGKFEKTIDTQMSVDDVEKEETLFLRYDLEWKGLGKPIIKSITFQGDTNLNMQAFIELPTGEQTKKKAVEELEETVYYVEVDDYKLQDPSFSLILEVDKENIDNVINTPAFHIQYKTFGITREQSIPMMDGDPNMNDSFK